MIKALFLKLTQKKPKDTSSKFSKFFREAPSAEKKKVFLDVARKASKEQLNLIKSVRAFN